tara:strand:+ start:152 stop:739 length:588 start_codon:yes stop_codon:yes gene_type:complete
MSLICPTCKEDTAGRIQKVAVGGVTEVHCNICYSWFNVNAEGKPVPKPVVNTAPQPSTPAPQATPAAPQASVQSTTDSDILAIDPDFKSKRQKIESDKPYDVYGPVNAPEILGIHGSTVAVDFDICIADGVCIDVCPTAVLEFIDTPGTNPHKLHPDLPPLVAEKKAAPMREDDCIFCMACEQQCPVTAIKIFQP